MRAIVWVMLLALAAAGGAHASGQRHVRGDFSFTVGPEPAFVQRNALPAAWGMEDDSGHGLHYWRYGTQADRRGGRDVVYVEHAYEARQVSALGDAGRFQVSYVPDYQELAFHRIELRREGQWLDRLAPEAISLARREAEFENDIADGSVTALVVLDDVRVGDIVRIGYTLSGTNPILRGQGHDQLRMEWGVPVQEIAHRILHDPGTVLAVDPGSGPDYPTIHESGDAVEVSLHRSGAPALHHEGGYPAWYVPARTVQIAPERSWADVVDWALPLYPPVDVLPAELEALLADWMQVADPSERARLALRTVQDQVRYFGIEMGVNTHLPNPPGVTWQRRFGDCKDKVYLLVEMLRRLGVDAVPALVSVHHGKGVRSLLPTARAFDHVVVRARLGDEVLWMDPTLRLEGGDLRQGDLSHLGLALPIEEGTDGLEPIDRAPSGESRTWIRERYRPLDAGAFELEVVTTYSGAAANGTRRGVMQQPLESLGRRYAEFYRKRFGTLEMLALPRFEDDRAANVVQVTESYRLAAPFRQDGQWQAIDLRADALQDAAGWPATTDRTAPLHFLTPRTLRHEVEFMPPEGWVPVFDEERSTALSPSFRLDREVSREDGLVRLVHHMEVDEPDVELAGLQRHLDAVKELNESINSTLRFRGVRQLGGGERQDRLRALLRNARNGEGAQP